MNGAHDAGKPCGGPDLEDILVSDEILSMLFNIVGGGATGIPEQISLVGGSVWPYIRNLKADRISYIKGMTADQTNSDFLTGSHVMFGKVRFWRRGIKPLWVVE